MICPRCEGTNIEGIIGAMYSFWCHDCKARVSLSEFCIHIFGDRGCGKPLPGECNKTLPNCRRHDNLVRFGGMPGVPGTH